MVARVLFLLLPCWENTTIPRPRAIRRGINATPNPSSSTLAPTDRPVSCLICRLRLMPLGRPPGPESGKICYMYCSMHVYGAPHLETYHLVRF